MVKKNSILNIHKNYLYILGIVLFLFIIYYFYKNHSFESFNNKNGNGNKNVNVNLKYFRCDSKKLGTINNEVFNDYGIIKDNNNWDIYVPCGYNHAEKELLTIQINGFKRNNKFIFGINGCDSIVSKNKIWETLVECYGRKEASLYMPESYVLHSKKEMDLFRKNFKSRNIYILKKNVQRKEGLKLTSNLEEILNSVMDNYRVAQIYLKNLYLVNKRKINLRIYLLVVIKDGYKIFYISKIGKCIYTKKEYNDNNFDFESNITSYHLDMTVYEKNPRNFNELFKYINNDGVDEHKSNILENNIYNLMKKVCTCISRSVYQSSNIKNTVSFQIFGGDVIFDNNLHPYLLEFNKGPDMVPRDDKDKFMKKKVQEDMFKTVGILPELPSENKQNNVFYEIYRTKL
jgi:hypothetical protein